MNKRRTLVAGGVVIDRNVNVLVLERDVLRDNGWIHEVRLPKGHVDKDETHEQCAKREVGEESGYWNVDIIADLGYDQSEFVFNGEQIIRDEHYFLMQGDAKQPCKPCPTGEEEARFKPMWVPIDKAEEMITYPTEKRFVRRAKAWLQMKKYI
ncbi:MAG TPA: NUDIX domain-containing protein [Candidatus Hydrogenedens sp.]|nr:NUDIX domain-containing protein [Candidatus Hydrogenedens sp.]HOK09482.1 NUDIX domain-containing protein [Candidatus Hydrogenedens sp.]